MMSQYYITWMTGLFLMVSTAWGQDNLNKQISTPEPGVFLKQWMMEDPNPANTLVVLDLDDTTITIPEGQWLGSSDMFYDLLGREQQAHPDKTPSELTESIDPLLMTVYQRVPITVTDPALPDILKELNKKGVTVIAMTARGKAIREVTLEQLQRTGIEFSALGDISRSIALDDKRTFHIDRAGVVFVNHGNKGETLVKLLREKILGNPENIIFIDDREKHLNNVKSSLQNSNGSIRYTPVLCTYLAERASSYNAKQADQQLVDFLFENRNEPKIRQLIETDEYTKKVLKSSSL